MAADLLQLRPYQREAIDAVHKAHDAGMRRPAVVLPTGAGKTVVFSHLASEHIAKDGTRVLVLVHRNELADQALNKLRDVAPHLRAGKVKAGDDETGADVVVASVQTLSRPARLQRLLDTPGAPIGLVIVDECHHMAARSYQTILDAFPQAKFLGVTATLARGDGVGLGRYVDDVVYTRSVLRMIADGYLVDPRAKDMGPDLNLDLSGVKMSGGDFQAAALGDLLMSTDAPRYIAQAMQEHAPDRRSVVFSPTVAVAEAVTKELNQSGMPCGTVSAKTPDGERDEIYSAAGSGELQVLSNVMVLTEGFDLPVMDCAVIARPTKSQPLFIQMVGRVLRPWPGKTDALVLDVAGSGQSIASLVDLSDGYVRSVRKGESLQEAALREEKEANLPVTAGSIAFAIKHREMDLFSGSSQNWLRTHKGVLFVPAGDTIVMLWPNGQPGLWDVAAVPKRGKWQKLREGLPLGTAQAWAEMCAEDYADFGTHRTASWRRGRPSQAQMDYATALGMPDLPGLTRGGVGDYISVALASRLIDRFVTTEGVMC